MCEQIPQLFIVPVCVEGAGCGGGSTEFQCGFKAACRTAAGVLCTATASTTATAAVCTCQCAKYAPVTNMPGMSVCNVLHTIWFCSSKFMSCGSNIRCWCGTNMRLLGHIVCIYRAWYDIPTLGSATNKSMHAKCCYERNVQLWQ